MEFPPTYLHAADPFTVYLAGPSGFSDPGLMWHNGVLVEDGTDGFARKRRNPKMTRA